MTPEQLATVVEAKDALSGVLKALLVVKPTLEQPYPDDARWTPWRRFVDGPFDHSSPWQRATRAHDALSQLVREVSTTRTDSEEER